MGRRPRPGPARVCPKEADMLWLWITVSVLAGLIALVPIVGSLLPKGHVVTLRARLDRPPQEVWDVLADFERHPTWRTDLKAVEVVSAGAKPLWKEIVRGMTLTLQRDEADPPRRLVNRIADPKLPFGGRWVFDLQPDGGGTLLTVTEEGEVYNPVFRFVGRFFLDQGAQIKRYLTQLSK